VDIVHTKSNLAAMRQHKGVHAGELKHDLTVYNVAEMVCDIWTGWNNSLLD